jgi:hypothetical protein
MEISEREQRMFVFGGTRDTMPEGVSVEDDAVLEYSPDQS